MGKAVAEQGTGKSTARKRSRARPALDLPAPRDFIPRLIRAHNNLVSAFENICDIHIARWRLLYAVGRLGTCSQNELSRSTTIGPAAVTRMLVDMERQRLITRKQSPNDSRQIDVELTATGEELVRATAAKREQFLKVALEGFSDAEVALLERLLGDLERNLAMVR